MKLCQVCKREKVDCLNDFGCGNFGLEFSQEQLKIFQMKQTVKENSK